MVQKSFGVIRGLSVDPKVTLGFEALTRTMRVGDRKPGGSVPPGGQDWALRSPVTSSGIIAPLANELTRRKRIEIMDFILNDCPIGFCGRCCGFSDAAKVASRGREENRVSALYMPVPELSF